jgi:hypothetical protein
MHLTNSATFYTNFSFFSEINHKIKSVEEFGSIKKGKRILAAKP